MAKIAVTQYLNLPDWLLEDAAEIIDDLSGSRYVALEDCGDYELPGRIIATLEAFLRAARKPQP